MTMDRSICGSGHGKSVLLQLVPPAHRDQSCLSMRRSAHDFVSSTRVILQSKTVVANVACQVSEVKRWLTQRIVVAILNGPSS